MRASVSRGYLHTKKDIHLNENEQKSILTVCLMAAFADGAKHDREREEIKRVASSLAGDASVNTAALYTDVLMKRVSLEQAAGALSTPEAKHLAFEMAVCVCDADGSQSEAERTFLRELRTTLGLDGNRARAYTEPVIWRVTCRTAESSAWGASITR